MPVGARGVHLSEWIDPMAEVTAIGFVVPTLDQRYAGANVAGGFGCLKALNDRQKVVLDDQ
jgi:hypothetical protein